MVPGYEHVYIHVHSMSGYVHCCAGVYSCTCVCSHVLHVHLYLCAHLCVCVCISVYVCICACLCTCAYMAMPSHSGIVHGLWKRGSLEDQEKEARMLVYWQPWGTHEQTLFFIPMNEISSCGFPASQRYRRKTWRPPPCAAWESGIDKVLSKLAALFLEDMFPFYRGPRCLHGGWPLNFLNIFLGWLGYSLVDRVLI